MSRKDDDGRVVVAVKVRPLSEQELADGCQACIYVPASVPQVAAGSHHFTYDQVYGGGGSDPDGLVRDCIAPLLDGLFNGYNATVFAYGQTGSGKTYTMGSAYTPGGGAQGVIPWVIDNLFYRIAGMKDVDCTVRVSFVEIHKEEVKDLLYTGAARARPAVTIREVLGSGVVLAGATEKEVKSGEETAAVLEQGTLCRATGATNMNNRSSRSHAVFTIALEQRRLAPSTPTRAASTGIQPIAASTEDGAVQSTADESDDESVIDDGVDAFLCAKMHLVDLAGSERAKRTKAQGARLREGIDINRGLFALSNVIVALVDGQRHVPYRDSKLTRLLQDSLGGNSRTVMVACISPADVNLDETVNTLRYADRARHIKNKPVVNRDPSAAALNHLRQQIAQLRAENNALRQAIGPDVNVQQLLDSQMDSTSLAVIEDFQQKIISMEVEQTKLYMDLERERAARKQTTESHLQAQKKLDQCRLLLDQLGIGDPKTFLEQQIEGSAIPDALENLLIKGDAGGSVLERMQQHYLGRIAQLEEQLEQEQDIKNSLMLVRGDSGSAALDIPSLATMSGALSGDPSSGDMSDVMLAREQENLQELLHKEQAKRLVTARLKEEMDQVNQKILSKDKLIKDMQEQANSLRMKEHYDKKLKDLQSELEVVQKERTTLVQKNAELHHMTSEERRRVESVYKERLATMDDKIKRMKDKEAEYREMAKMKNQAEGLCNKLQHELQALKQQKISLQRRVEDAQKDFILWKQQHEREVQMLRKKGRRDAIELQKAEALAAKRLAILQRKSSEAEAARKRVKDLIERQTKQAREGSMVQRESSLANGNGSVDCQPNPDAPLLRTEKARRDWVEEQLALCNQSAEYQKMMDGEIAERGEFSRQLREVQKKISILRNDTPATPIPGMPLATPQRASAVKNLIREPIEKLQQKQAELEKEINIRNKNIAELQAAWSQAKADEESKGAGAADAKRWTGLRGILECREFLRTLFRVAHDYRAQCAESAMDSVRLQEELDLLNLKHEASRDEVSALKRRNATLITMVGSSRPDPVTPGCVAAADTDNDVDKEAATLLQRFSELKGHQTRSARQTDASDMEEDASQDDDTRASTRRSLHNALLDVPSSRSPLQTSSTPVNAWQPAEPQPASAPSTAGQVEDPAPRAAQMDVDMSEGSPEDSDDTDDPSYEPKRVGRNNRASRPTTQHPISLPDMTAYERKEWEQEVLNHINMRLSQQGYPLAVRLTTKVLKEQLTGKVLRGKEWRAGRKTKDQLIMDYREMEGLDAAHSSLSENSSEDMMMVDEPMTEAAPLPPPKKSTNPVADLLPLDKHRERFKQERRSAANFPFTSDASSPVPLTANALSPRGEGLKTDTSVDSTAPPPSPQVMQLMERKWRSQERMGTLRGGK